MRQSLIFGPVLVQVLLTFVVWLRLYFTRVAEMQRERIHPQKLARAGDAQHLLQQSAGGADNFRNLFEMPVLFFVAAVSAHSLFIVDTVLLALAWVFVLLRIVHSVIHVTYNRVIHRFYVYLASCIAVWAMWIIIALRLYDTGV